MLGDQAEQRWLTGNELQLLLGGAVTVASDCDYAEQLALFVSIVQILEQFFILLK